MHKNERKDEEAAMPLRNFRPRSSIKYVSALWVCGPAAVAWEEGGGAKLDSYSSYSETTLSQSEVLVIFWVFLVVHMSDQYQYWWLSIHGDWWNFDMEYFW